MAYKMSKGKRGFGDINFEDDADTGIDFEADTIKLETGGAERVVVTNNDITLSGDVIIDQYIKHNGDNDTHINFADDKIVLKAGNKAMITMEEKGTAPHEVTINDGSNNIDFVVKGNGSAGGNPGMKFDASTNRLGINGVGEPDEHLHVGGNMKLDGSEATIFLADGDTEKATIGINSSDNILIENKVINKHIVFKVNDQGAVKEGFRIDGAVPEVVVNQTSDSLVDFRVESNNQTHMLFVDGSEDKIGIKTASPIAELDVAGKIAISLESQTPAQPADGKGYLYSKNDGKLYWRSHDKTEADLTAGSGEASAPPENIITGSSNISLDTSHNRATIIITPTSGDVTYTLPPPSANYKIKFLAGTNLTSHNIIFKANQSSQKIFGMFYRINFGGGSEAGYDTSPQSYNGADASRFAGGASEVHKNTITIDNALQGTDIDFYSDGSYWYAKGSVVSVDSGVPATITWTSGSY